MINVEIDSIVKNLDNNIDFLQPLFETITNSFQAHAHNIVIKIKESSILDIDNFIPTMIGFSIEDDGDGFTEDNIESFCTLWSKYKFDLGCKGSGRFTWLNVYNQIDILSEVSETKEIVSIPFNLEFDKNKIKRISNKLINKSKTLIDFKYVTDKYYREQTQTKKGFDKRCYSDADYIKCAITDYLFVTFAQLKEHKYNFKITIVTSSKTVYIDQSDINCLRSHSFIIKRDFNGNTQKFTIKYVFKKDKNDIKKIVLCSNERSAHTIKPTSIGINDCLPNKDSIYAFVTSTYLDGIDTDDRRGLNTYASSNRDPDIIYPIAYSELLEKIRESLKIIIQDEYPSTTDSNKKALEQVRQAKPYLGKYLDEVDGAVISEKSAESDAIKRFEKDKIETSKRFVTALNDRNIDSKTFMKAVNDLSMVSAAELGEYIVYRSQILDALTKERLKDKREDYLHNIFMPKNTSCYNPNEYLNTNMWIIDDKFMSYLYAASDITFKTVNSALTGEIKRVKYDLRRPDTIVVFDKKEGIKNCIIIEFKAYSAKIDEKAKALTEISNNIATFRQLNKDINSIWAYIITKIDDDFKQTIINTGSFKEIFTAKNSLPAYYRFNESQTVNAHIYIYDVDAIVEEAKTRNSVFSNILDS